MNDATAYHRVSGSSQVAGDGFPRQHEATTTFALGHGLNIVRSFDEMAVPGATESMDRPAFSEMIEYMQEYGIKTIVVERMDRLARDLMVSEMLLKECRERGIKVFCTDQGMLIDMASDGDDPTRKLIRQIMGALAEWEKASLVRKLRAARIRTGRFGSRAAYGKRNAEPHVIRMINALRKEGRSYRDIASSLNEMHIPTRDNKAWHKQTVINVLRAAPEERSTP